MKIGVEDKVQIDIVEMFESRRVPGAICFHVPNGGWRGVQEAMKFKLMGVLPGVPDLVFLHAGHAFFGEVKTTRKGSGKSGDQDRLHQRLLQGGFAVGVWRSPAEAEKDLLAWGLVK